MNTITWRAVYTDGTYLDSKDAEKGYESIDRERLASFCLVQRPATMEDFDVAIEKAQADKQRITDEMEEALKLFADDKRRQDVERALFKKEIHGQDVRIAKIRLKKIEAGFVNAMFGLWGIKEKIIFNLKLQEGQRLIWRKRTMSTVGNSDQVWHLVGWQKTVNGENIQCIGYVSEEDGSVIMAGEWQGEHILLGAVEPLDFE